MILHLHRPVVGEVLAYATATEKEHHFVLWIVFAITASFLYNERRTEKICTAVVERVSGKGKSTGAGK